MKYFSVHILRHLGFNGQIDCAFNLVPHGFWFTLILELHLPKLAWLPFHNCLLLLYWLGLPSLQKVFVYRQVICQDKDQF